MEYNGFEIWTGSAPGCRKAFFIDRNGFDLSGVHHFKSLKSAQKACDELIAGTFKRVFATQSAEQEWRSKNA